MSRDRLIQLVVAVAVLIGWAAIVGYGMLKLQELSREVVPLAGPATVIESVALVLMFILIGIVPMWVALQDASISPS